MRRLLRELALPELLGAVQGAKEEMLAVRSSNKPQSRSRKAEAACARLRVTGWALYVAAGQCARLLRACLDCADALAVEVAQGYFLNLALLLLALLGRIHALVRHAGLTAMYVGQALLAQQPLQQPAEAGAELTRVSVISSGQLAGALGVQGEATGGTLTRASRAPMVTTTKEGGAEAVAAVEAGDDEDDLGVALGRASVALPEAPAPWRGLTTRVIPAAKGKASAQGQGRALLATDWSSSEEEEEEETSFAVASAPSTSEVAGEDVKDEEKDEVPLFMLDREPKPPAPLAAKPGKEKDRDPKPPTKATAMPLPSFLGQQKPPPQAPVSAASLPSIGRKRKSKPKKQSAGEEASKKKAGSSGKGGGGSPLDVIDMIFEAAAPQGMKRMKG